MAPPRRWIEGEGPQPWADAEDDDLLLLTAFNWGLGTPANAFLQPLQTMRADVVQGWGDDLARRAAWFRRYYRQRHPQARPYARAYQRRPIRSSRFTNPLPIATTWTAADEERRRRRCR